MASMDEWQQRQKDIQSAEIVADEVGKATAKNIKSNALGFACTLAAIFVTRDNPAFGMMVSTAVIAAQGWLSRMEMKNLRQRFNGAAGMLGHDGRNILRPLHQALPDRQDKVFTLDDLNPKKYPFRMFGGLIAMGIAGPFGGATWICADILGQEIKEAGQALKVANTIQKSLRP